MDFKQFFLCDELVLGKHFWLEIFLAVISLTSHNSNKKSLQEMQDFAIQKNGIAPLINSHWKHLQNTNKSFTTILARSTVMKLISKKRFTGSMSEPKRKQKREILSEPLSQPTSHWMNWKSEKKEFFQELWKIA